MIYVVMIVGAFVIYYLGYSEGYRNGENVGRCIGQYEKQNYDFLQDLGEDDYGSDNW